MTYAKLIHDYFDGELNEPQKEALFAQLGKESAIRSEFDQQMKLHLIAQSDMGSISPPIDATNNIFYRLGFAIPSNDYLAKLEGNGANTAKSGSMFKKAIPLIIAAFLASTFTAGLFLTYMNIGSQSNINGTFADVSQIPVTKSFENDTDKELRALNSDEKQGNLYGNPGSHTNAESIIISDRGNNRSNRKSQATNDIVQNTSNQQVSSDSDESSQANNRILFTDENNVLIAVSSDINNELSKMNDNARQQFIDGLRNSINSKNIYTPEILQVDNYADKGKLDFRLRKLPITNTVVLSEEAAKTINSKSTSSSLDGYGLSVLYAIDDYQSLGIEIGSEQFAQNFVVKDYGTYSQMPRFFWIGAAYRLSLPNLGIENTLYPYGQLFAGYTSVGPLFRTQAGIVFKPVNNLSLFAGYEGGILIYNVYGTIYGSGKHGFTYGLSYSF